MSYDYFAVDAWNASKIKKGAESMLHLQHYIDHGVKTTPAMRAGTLRHMALLEPDKFGQLSVYQGDKRGKEYKLLKADVGEDNTISASDAAEIALCAATVMSHPAVESNGLFRGGDSEKEYYWEEPFGSCKAKIDYVGEGYFIEYKTTQKLQFFSSTAAKMHYHLGLGWYYRACNLPCYVVAQEQYAPYDVAVYRVEEFQLQEWGNKCVEIIERYLSGEMLGTAPEVMSFELPTWAQDDIITLDMEDGNE